MKKSLIWLLTGVMAITFGALLYFQIMYLENMVKMRDEQFSEGVMRSLYATSEFLEREETLHFLEQDINIIESSFYDDYTSGKSEYDKDLKYSVENPDGTVTNYTLSSKVDKSKTDPSRLTFPSATQNEINGEDARTLIKNGCTLVAEGANMPTDLEGIETYLAAKILYGPAKAANAGGVATSGLEMSQNSQRLSWTREEVDHKLKTIMANIHANAVAHAHEYSSDKSFTNYVTGANIAGFVKVAGSPGASLFCGNVSIPEVPFSCMSQT